MNLRKKSLFSRSRRPAFLRSSKTRRKVTRLSTWAALGLGAFMTVRTVSRKRREIDFQGKTVVITGGSRGLGLVLARQFAEEGARLALVARDIEELQRAETELANMGAEVMIEVCDVRDRRQVEEALGRVVRRFGQLNVLVNNAGIIQVGPIDHMRLEDFEDAMDVHFWGPLYSIMAARHYMRQQGGGRIVNIASIGGKVAVPHLAPYTASKFALVGLSDGMRAELAEDKILVTTVSPGLMRTGSFYNALFKGRSEEEFTWFAIGAATPGLAVSPESAAKQIINACRYGSAELVISPQARLLAKADELFPKMTAGAMKMVNRFIMPERMGEAGDLPLSGWQSREGAKVPEFIREVGRKSAREHRQYPGPSAAGD
jgi:NAD(P)-dependent dehydrogenase (short-subunit alcohol dehydrogenase family)